MIAGNALPAATAVAPPPAPAPPFDHAQGGVSKAEAPPRNVIMWQPAAVAASPGLVSRIGRDMSPLDTKEEAMIAGNTPPAATDVAPPPAPAPPRNVIVSQPAVDPASPLLAHLLAMADGYLAQGALWHAMEIYLKIVERHDEAPEARLACQRLLGIAERHEKNGKGHLARSIYERLL